MGTTDCTGTCRDLQTDLYNCGACGTVCPAGQICSMGMCQLSCGGGTTNCTGVCRDTQTDLNHCGMCGNVCPSNQQCNNSMCAPP